MSFDSRGGRGGKRGGVDSGAGDRSGRGSLRGGSQGGHNDFRGGPQPGRGDFRGGRGGANTFRGDRGGRGGAQNMAFRGPNPGPPQVGGIFQPVTEETLLTPPNANVTNTENALVSVTCGQIIDNMPGRRSYGTKGKLITLRTNYFQVQTAFESGQPDIRLFRYNVDITSDLSKPKRRRLLLQLVADARFNVKGMSVATDCSGIIVTTAKVDLGKWTTGDQILLSDPSATAPSASPAADSSGSIPAHVAEARRRNMIMFKVDFQTSYTLRHMIEFLRSNSAAATYAGRGDIIQLLNIIMCKTPLTANNITAIAGNKFYPNQAHPGGQMQNLGGGLVGLRGYYSSIRPAVGRILLNLNVTSGAFYKAVPVADLLRECGKNGSALQEAFIRMLKIEVLYKPANEKPFTKTKTIVGFTPGPDKNAPRRKRFGNADETKFSYLDAGTGKTSETSVAAYFKSRYGIILSRPQLPVLNVGTRKDPQYIPVELSTVLPGQRYGRLLSGEQTTNMLGFAARFPNLNATSITTDGLKVMGLDQQPTTVNPFGFRVFSEMVTVPGRILPTPQVKYLKDTVNARNGSWNCDKQKFTKPATFGRWATVMLDFTGKSALNENPPPDMFNAQGLIGELSRYLKLYGLTMGTNGGIARQRMHQLSLENRAKNDALLVDIFDKQQAAGTKMLLIILADADKWLYARIKFFADTHYGIQTICSVGSKLQKPKNQGMYMGNLALKFNIKGGGVNHTVPGAMVAPMDTKTMLMGIDFTHPSPGSSPSAPSIACVVASQDSNMCQWPGSIRKQKGRQEMVGEERRDADMVNGLVEMVLERLKLWQARNRELPKKIIVYRDGVSEGQYALVLEKELPSFHKAFETVYSAKSKCPAMAIIVVGKRHHTRFYPTKQAEADFDERNPRSSWNCVPGTVVDRGITGHTYHEFYLQAHQGLQGTARSAHYVIIKDDLGFTADAWEQLTHNLCYLFSRATKAVSVVPPAYYADILAERGRAYLFHTLQEDHTAASDTASVGSSSADSEWNGQIHPALKDTTWYV